jgi:hypothetical protein
VWEGGGRQVLQLSDLQHAVHAVVLKQGNQL